jgi:hypothetical protein
VFDGSEPNGSTRGNVIGGGDCTRGRTSVGSSGPTLEPATGATVERRCGTMSTGVGASGCGFLRMRGGCAGAGAGAAPGPTVGALCDDGSIGG